MKTARLFALLALALVVVPAVLFAAGIMGDAAMKLTLLVATILWFVAAPRWLRGGTE